MDDDILLEPESVVRTVSLLSYARSVDLCVHGAMMSEEQPWMQFEAGANYEFRSVYPLRAVGRLDDMRATRKVVLHVSRPAAHVLRSDLLLNVFLDEEGVLGAPPRRVLGLNKRRRLAVELAGHAEGAARVGAQRR